MNSSLEGTPADEVRSTVEDLQTGLALVPRAQAIRRIDMWHRLLSASDRRDLQQIAAGLQDLKSHLLSADLKANPIGEALARLGQQTVAAASQTDDDDTGRAVQRLGTLLLHAGHALRGPRPAPH